MIKEMLSRTEAERIFLQECILLSGKDAITERRAVELFGARAQQFIKEGVKSGELRGGADYNAVGDCTPESPLIRYFTRDGFYKIVSNNNYLILAGSQGATHGPVIVSFNGTKAKAGSRAGRKF